MFKTPPRIAGLGIALTTCAIGAGGAMSAGQMAEVSEISEPEMILEFEGPEFGMLQIEFTPDAPEVTAVFEVAEEPGWNG